MTKRISFNAFEMNCIAHQSPGLWRHPQDRSVEYKDLEYWTDLAQILERGFFDGIFTADAHGNYLEANCDPARGMAPIGWGWNYVGSAGICWVLVGFGGLENFGTTF